MSDRTEIITAEIEGQFTPTQAIIVYKWNSDYYLESHEISQGRMRAGQPVTEELVAGLAEYFGNRQAKNSIIKGRIPATLLHCEWHTTRKLLVWYNQPQPRKMFFAKALHIPTGIANQPGLIYVADGNELSVYAIKAGPTDDAILHRAPYHNVDADGEVCLGSAKVKQSSTITYQNQIERWEGLFWLSEFSHLTGSTSPINGNLNTYWKNAVGSKKPFVNTLLLPTKQTLAQLLKSL